MAAPWGFTSKLHSLQTATSLAAAITPCGAGGVAVTPNEVSDIAVTGSPTMRRGRVTRGQQVLRPPSGAPPQVGLGGEGDVPRWGKAAPEPRVDVPLTGAFGVR